MSVEGQGDEQLLFLFAHDSDPFNRCGKCEGVWESVESCGTVKAAGDGGSRVDCWTDAYRKQLVHAMCLPIHTFHHRVTLSAL